MARKVEIANGVPLFVATYAPGDGVTRYRFFTKETDYFAGGGIKTVLGIKDAQLFADAFASGYMFATAQDWSR